MRAEGKEKPAGFDNTSTTAISAVLASYKCKAAAIVVLTTSGSTSHIVSKYKPHCPILSVTRYGQVARQMQIFRGCIPLLYEKEREADWMKDVDDRVQYAIDFGEERRGNRECRRLTRKPVWRRRRKRPRRRGARRPWTR